MTAPTLDVAIVGCGIIGVVHARALARVDGVRVTDLVDTAAPVAESLADLIEGEHGAPRPIIHSTIADLRENVDVVVICTPSGTHVGLAEEALHAGRHVVLEKPLDVDMTRGRRLAELAADASTKGRIVSVISQHRFDPASVAVADAAHGGRLGRVSSAIASVAWWRSQEYFDSGAWRGTWTLDGGGAVMNQGVHTVDLLVWFLGEPVEVSAQTVLLAHEGIEVEDVAVATVRFASGALAVFHATTAAYPGLSVRVQVFGSAGSAVIDDDQLGWFSVDGQAESSADAAVPAGERLGDPKSEDAFVEGHARQYRDIVAAIHEGRAPKVGVPEALLSLAVVRSIYVSATTGAPVRVADVLSGAVSDAAVLTGGIR